MNNNILNDKIKVRGRELFANIQNQTPAVFDKKWWTGKVLDWAMSNEHFKVQLFRFVDVFPYLNTDASLTRHIREYFGQEEEIPTVLKWGARGSGLAVGPAGKLLSRAIRSNIRAMARHFIIGQTAEEAIKVLHGLHQDDLAFTVNFLGEATVSQEEEEEFQKNYLWLMDVLAQAARSWEGQNTGHDWGYSPKINLSIKPTSLYCQTRPSDFEGSVNSICSRLVPVLDRARAVGAHVCIDMEEYSCKDITLEVYRRLRSHPGLQDYPELSVVLQSYLKDTDRDLDELLSWARKRALPVSVRLVKGAYWDYETVLAKQQGWEIPVYVHKSETDAAFERQAWNILRNHHLCYFASGSHNIRSIAAVLEMAEEIGVPRERYEFQMLYGLAEPVRKAVQDMAGKVRLYCSYGDLIPGMGYLVRRLLENTSNESFLRQSFAEGQDIESLLEDPKNLVKIEGTSRDKTAAPEPLRPSEHFRNEPLPDFSKENVRLAFPRAIQAVRRETGRIRPLFIGGRKVQTEDVQESCNPDNPEEIVGRVCQASTREIDRAIEAAAKAFPDWRETSARDRAGYIMKAADIARRNIYNLAAWQVLEVGKQWAQSYADVTEAIDFMEYYARQMIKLGAKKRTGKAPGEVSHYFYQPKGLAAVIGPWNFPMAISCGMSSAAMVTGNCVLYKPSALSSVVGSMLADVYRQAGIPAGVFNFVPGRSSHMGDYLVQHPKIGLIAFTGSLETGLGILEKAGKTKAGQDQVKKVIAEMGGKNAIIVDEDADLDEAVQGIIYSAFGYQGQKCSACSRVIALEGIYERFVHRLIQAAGSLKIGPPEDPHYYMGPVVDRAQRDKVLGYIELAGQEGEILLQRNDLPEKGYYVPLTIAGSITPQHRLAQEEIFGPMLAVMRVEDFDQALGWANSTPFALTGAVYSRSPEHLRRAADEFQAGNLYLNRGNTGSMVERHPFGGFKLSGVGSKTGGPDYLLQFMNPRTVTENTLRRGFAPIQEGDDWLD